MKKVLSLVLAVVLLAAIFTGCGSSKKEETFYNLVSGTQELLDEYADDIYSCWHAYVYKDEYSSVDSALLAAMAMNYDNIATIEACNERIKVLYGQVKDGKLKSEIKAVMQAYNDYYALVMEVSGSFNSFSADKETLKKEFSSAIRDLEFELQ